MGETPRQPTATADAFRRLLVDAAGGGQAKVDAVVALSQRTLYVVTWPTTNEGFRTLVNSQGIAGLPVFTDETELGEAARRFGWMNPDGSLPSREIGAREAFSHAVAHNLTIVIDIAADHSIELEPSEVAPLLTPQSRRESSGPFAGAGRISSSLLAAVRTTPSGGLPNASAASDGPLPRVTPPPGTIPAQGGARGAQVQPAPQQIQAPLLQVAAVAAATVGGRAASFGGVSGVTIARLSTVPSDDLLDKVSDFLRGYPEVEWACIAAVSRGPTSPVPTVGLRVDTSFRTRVGEIVQGLRDVATGMGASVDVFLLDDPGLMRAARSEAMMFYPWRK